MANYSGVMGLQAAILRSQNDGVIRVRVLHGELARCAEAGVAALAGLAAEVEVLYREDSERPLAEAHCIILQGHGLTAKICPV